MKRFITACICTIAVGLTAFLIATAGNSPAGAGGDYGWTQLNGGNSPYDYPTVAFTCHGTDGVYISSFANSGATAGGDVFVVPNDRWCVG